MSSSHTPSEPRGLTSQEAEQRLRQFGPNVIERRESRGVWKLFFGQFTSPLTLILLAAAGVSFGIGFLPGQTPHVVDVVLILVIVGVSGVLGFVQDYQAENAIESIQQMATPHTLVLRDGVRQQILTTELVPGDVFFLESGNIIPADATLLSSLTLSVNEAPLTGESRAVAKRVDDPLFMGTFVVAGDATATVTATGFSTKVGAIASGLESIQKTRTSFEEEIHHLVKTLSLFMLGLVVLVFAIGYVRYGLYDGLLTAISLAVAAIPEGLPAIVALTLAIGAKRMSRHRALVRRMAVTESLGSVNVICTDKTGTLTKNQMEVTRVVTPEAEYHLEEAQDVTDAGTRVLEAGLLASGGVVEEQDGERTYFGDSTEVGLMKVAYRFGIMSADVLQGAELVHDIPFTSERKRSSRIYAKGSKGMLYTKGAGEVLLPLCSKELVGGKEKGLSDARRKVHLETLKRLSSEGLRMIACASRSVSTWGDDEELEQDLVFLGFEGMSDPIHEGVPDAVRQTLEAGIRVIMLTGDNPQTGEAIARQAGIETTETILGDDLDAMDDAELERRLTAGANVFARVSPFHKLRVLKLLQKEYRVAMTGDGVNDALALKRADVGIAMGLRGTDVAKESSDIILVDDNFVSIVGAIKEGRTIFDNIKKFINYLFVSNLAEILVITTLTVVASLKFPPLLPVQILWINLLTDGFPALALGADPARPDIMKQAPRPKGEPIIDRTLKWVIGVVGVKKAVMLLIMYTIAREMEGPEVARTVLFTGFIVYEFVRIGVIRVQEKLTWFSNPWLLVSLVISMSLQLTIIYTPLRRYFSIVPLGWESWVLLLIGAFVGYVSAIWVTNVITRMTQGDLDKRVHSA